MMHKATTEPDSCCTDERKRSAGLLASTDRTHLDNPITMKRQPTPADDHAKSAILWRTALEYRLRQHRRNLDLSGTIEFRITGYSLEDFTVLLGGETRADLRRGSPADGADATVTIDPVSLSQGDSAAAFRVVGDVELYKNLLRILRRAPEMFRPYGRRPQ